MRVAASPNAVSVTKAITAWMSAANGRNQEISCKKDKRAVSPTQTERMTKSISISWSYIVHGKHKVQGLNMDQFNMKEYLQI